MRYHRILCILESLVSHFDRKMTKNRKIYCCKLLNGNTCEMLAPWHVQTNFITPQKSLDFDKNSGRQKRNPQTLNIL